MKKTIRWSDKEVKLLRKWYPDKGAFYCASILDRGVMAVRRMAARISISNKRVKIRYSEDSIKKAVAANKSISGVIRSFGLRAAGGNHAVIKKYIKKYKIDTSHFEKQSERARYATQFVKKDLKSILVENNHKSNGTNVKERLYKEGLKERKCELCGQGEIWKGKKLSLILDHKNGIHSDFRLENLQIVCPNCDATSETYCRGTRRKREKGVDGRKLAKGSVALKRRKVERPTLYQLLNDLDCMSYLAVGRKYGVSDNAIRKWIKSYGGVPPKK